MGILAAGAFVVVFVLFLGIMQTLGETRLSLIFPIISILAVLLFLARCMFTSPAHH